MEDHWILHEIHAKPAMTRPAPNPESADHSSQPTREVPPEEALAQALDWATTSTPATGTEAMAVELTDEDPPPPSVTPSSWGAKRCNRMRVRSLKRARTTLPRTHVTPRHLRPCATRREPMRWSG